MATGRTSLYPLILQTYLQFTIKNDAFTGPTHINATALTVVNGYEFSSTSAEISIQEKETPPEDMNTLTLSGSGGGIYFPDIQASFPEVDWQTLDRLYIAADNYYAVKLGNLPHRTSDRPLIITNLGGQVYISNRSGNIAYGLSLYGGSNWILTGKYDPEMATGDIDFPGHQNGKYANSEGTYGIQVEGICGGSCVIIGQQNSSYTTTNYQVSYLELSLCGFAGILAKTDGNKDATMDGVKIHDLYIHDVESEGLYLGNTSWYTPDYHKFTNLEVYNNRVVRAGTEGMQFAQMGDGVKIHHNVLVFCGIDWKNPFQAYQDGNFQYYQRDGNAEIHHNIFIGGNNLLIFKFYQDPEVDNVQDGDGVRIHHNYFSSSRRGRIAYINAYDSNAPETRNDISTLTFENNIIRNCIFEYDDQTDNIPVPRVDPDPPDTLFNINASAGNPMYFNNNIRDGSIPFFNLGGIFKDNGDSVNKHASGNQAYSEIDPVIFMDTTFPPVFEYQRLETWDDYSDTYNVSLSYKYDDYVMIEPCHDGDGQLYKCIKSGTNSGKDPLSNPDIWQAVTNPSDDLRLALNSPYQDMGLIKEEKYQLISLKPEQLTKSQGDTLTITPSYNVSDADNTLSGIGVIIHFDSRKLAISENDITNIYSNGKQGNPLIRDEGQNENDHDPNTDKVIVFFWSDPFSGDWPNQSLPIDLANIQFTVINDAASGSTNINATASTLANGYEFTSTSAGVMIQAKETLPLVEWCSSSQSINEDAGNISLTACLSESTSTDVIIPYTVKGSAISGTDHNLSNGLLTILSGQTKASQVISIIDDTDVENSETIVITMGSPINAEPGAITVHSITINDKDIPEITIICDDYVNENSTSILTVQLDQPNPREDIEIQYQVNGTAVIDSDYSIEPESPLTIASGQTEVKLTITTLEDNDVEPNKTMILSLNNPTHADLGDASEHTVTILDNDSPQISWNVADQNVWEDVGAITITAQLDKTSFQAVTASFIVSGSDHDLQPGQIEIESGQISASTTFNIIPESECEAHEAIKITLTNSQNANLGSIPLHTVYVQEICPNFVTDGDIERMEDCGQQTITAWASSITTGKSGPDSFGFIVETDNDTLFSVQPDISNDGNFTFTPKPDVSGSASVDVFLQVDDYYVSASKSFTIDILPVNDCPVFSMPKTYTINEDAGYQAFSNWVSNRSAGATDEASNQTLTLSVTDTTNSEMFEQTPLLNENGDLTFQVKKNANGNSVVTVELRDDGITDNNGCNSIEKTFNIVVKGINDQPVNTIRPDLSGVLQLDQTLTGRKGLWNDDHDQSPGTITYTYQWEMADNQNGMNVSPIPDETENTLELVQPLFGKFIRLAVTASDDGEGKPIVQSTTRKSDFYGPVKNLPLLSFEEKGQRKTESSGQIQIPVKIGRSSEVDVTVPYSIEGTSSDSDYTISSTQPLTIEKGQTTGQIIVEITDDTEDEADETIILILDTPTNAILGSITSYTITIKRNDSTPEISSISPETSYAGGGDAVSITGNHFVSGATVSFNGVQTNSSVESNKKISCIVPPYDGELTQNTEVTVTVTNPGGNSDEINFTYLSMTSIGGRVTADSDGISSCLIQVRRGNKTFFSTTNENGYYTVNDLKLDDQYVISAWPDKALSCYNSEYYDDKNYNTADTVSTMSGSRFDIDFSLETCANGQITGDVKDGDGNTLSSGELLVMAFSMSLNDSGFAIPEPDGSYTIKGLKSATDYEVSVHWTEKPEVDFYYSIPEGETVGVFTPTDSVIVAQDATPITVNNNQVSNIHLIVDASFTGLVKGYVKNCYGNPAANIPVFAKSNGLNVQQFVRTDSKGYYEFKDLPRVEEADRLTKGYIISAKKKNYPTRYYQNTNNIDDASLVITDEADDTNINGIGCGHKISGRITDESGRPVYNVPILVRSLSSDEQSASGTVYSNIRGDYTITLMPLNDYIVRVVPDDYQLQYYNNATTQAEATLIDISSGNQTGIDFVLTEGPKLCGQITINGSAANEGIPVNIWSESTQTGRTVLTDSDGLYEISGLDADASDYIISVITSGYLPSFYHPDGTKYSWSEAGNVSPSSTCDKNIDVVDGFTIYGQVSYDGNPVYNVDVEAFASDTNGWGMDVSHRISGSEYNFVIKALKPGNYEITADVTQDCYSASPKSVSISTQDVVVEIELLNTCASIYGTINDLPSDKTVFVTVLSQSTLNFKKVSVVNNSQSTANIPYTITNLKPAADYIVKMTSSEYPKQYYQNQTNWSDADEVNISTGNQTGIDFTVVTPKTITGEITFINAEAGDEATVIAESRSLNTEDYFTVIYPETQYTLIVKPASDYVVSIRSFKFTATPDEQNVDATFDVSDIDFTLNAGAEISGHIYDEDGNAVSGIAVEAWSDFIPEWSIAKTDNSGAYTIKGLTQADDYIVYVDHPTKSYFYYSTDGTKSNASKVDVTNGNASDIDIQFFTIQSITGTVIDENGKALSNIWVYAWSDTEQSGNGAKTKSDGTFEILGLTPAVDYEVEATPYGSTQYRSAIKSNIASGDTDITFILLEGYTLDGTITNIDGDPISKVVVEIRSVARDFYRRKQTNSQGSYQIKGIVPSQDYKLFATASGEDSYIPVKADIVITNDTTKDIELTSAFKLYGYVREDGTGIKNVLVTILSNSNDYFANEATDSLGYYEFSNVPAGSDYQVTARPVDYAQKTHVDQAAGTEVNFDLSSGGPISGYVRDASFNPLSNIRVKLKSSSQDLKKTTRTDTDGYYIFNGLSKYDLSGAMIADYEITVKSSDYPKQVVSNIKVDDTVDFTLSSSDDNLISGVVTDSSGELPSSSKYVEVFIFEEDSSRKPFDRVKTDENGKYEFTGLTSDQEYHLMFKIKKGSNKKTKRWASTGGPEADRDNATEYLPGNSVDFQFDVTW
jgi:hypothetical protein